MEKSSFNRDSLDFLENLSGNPIFPGMKNQGPTKNKENFLPIII